MLSIATLNPTNTSDISEAMAKARCLWAGYQVLTPGKVCRYDFVIEDEFRRRRNVQVKTGRFRGGSIIANAYSVDSKRKGDPRPIQTSKYVGQVDDIAIYCFETDRVYLVPMEIVGNKVQIYLRVEPTHTGGHLWAKDFQLERETRIERATT